MIVVEVIAQVIARPMIPPRVIAVVT